MKNGIQKKIKVYVIQENIGGVSEDPLVFTESRRANNHYIKLVNEVHGTDFKTMGETVDYMKKNNGEDDHEILYWTLNVEDKDIGKTVEVNRKDLEKLLDYVRDAELEDFENTEVGCRTRHIYKVIRKLDKGQ